MFNSRSSILDGTSLHHITNEPHVVTPAVQRPACQRPQKQDEAYASVAILAQEPFLVRTCTVIFPFTSVSGFALSMCLQTNFLCLQLSHPFSWLPMARVKMQCTLPFPGRRRYLRMLVLLMVLVMTTMEWAPAPEILWMKSSMPFSQNLCTSKRRSLKFLLSRLGCPVWIHI